MSEHIITFTEEEESAIIDSGTNTEDWLNGLIARARESLLQSYHTRKDHFLLDKINALPEEEKVKIADAVDVATEASAASVKPVKEIKPK